MSGNEAAASGPDNKEKPGDVLQNVNPDQRETAAKEAKQKGEKRKAEPGKAPNTRDEMETWRHNLAVKKQKLLLLL